MEKKNNPKGWEALKIKLRERGIMGMELEEAQSSFHKGIEVLSRLFLSCYLVEKQSGNQIFKKRKSLTKDDKGL